MRKYNINMYQVPIKKIYRTKQLYRVERERVVTDWWYVEANDEKEAKTKENWCLCILQNCN